MLILGELYAGYLVYVYGLLVIVIDSFMALLWVY